MSGREAGTPPTGVIGGRVGVINVTHLLWAPPYTCILLQIYWYKTVDVRQLLTGGGTQPHMGVEEVGMDDVGFGEKGGGCMDVMDILRCSGTCDASIWGWSLGLCSRVLGGQWEDLSTGWPTY